MFLFKGTDEHGQKISQAAKEKKLGLEEFCKRNSEKFKLLNTKYSISNSHFIRTSEGYLL